MSLRNNILLWFLLFLLLYFEGIDVAGIKISQVWKIPFYLYALAYIIKNINLFDSKVKAMFWAGFLAGIKIILNINFYQGFLMSLAEFFYAVTLPIVILFFYLLYKQEPDKLRILLTYFSIFLIISNIPFILDVLPQRNKVVELDKYGLEDQSMLNGLFYHTSATSKILVVAVLYLFSALMHTKSSFYRKLYVPIFIFGLYCVYLSYTRTGWLLLIVGMFFLFFYKVNLTKLKRLIPLLIIGILTIAYLLKDNEALLLRLQGGTTYRQNEEFDPNVLTSYRLALFAQSLINFYEDGVPSMLMGQGRSRAQQLMGESYGTDFVAHNRFIEVLQYGGIIGLMLFLLFLFRLWAVIKSINVDKSDYLTKLPFALFIVFIMALLPSHGFPIWSDLIFGGVVALNLINQEQKRLDSEKALV